MDQLLPVSPFSYRIQLLINQSVGVVRSHLCIRNALFRFIINLYSCVGSPSLSERHIDRSV